MVAGSATGRRGGRVHPRKAVRDILAVAMGQYVARAVLLLRGVVAAAVLGPRGAGGWNALNLVLDYGAYASLGAVDGLELRLPGAVGHGDRERAERLMRGAWAVVLLGMALLAGGLALYLASGTRAIEVAWGWRAPALMLVAGLVQLAIYYHASSLRAHGDFGVVSGALAMQALVGGGLGVALVPRLGVWGLIGGWIVGGLVAVALLRRAPHKVPLAPGRLRDGLELVAAGLPVFGYFATTLIVRTADRMALVRHGEVESLGHYSLGLMAAGLVLYLPEATAAVLYPRIAAAAHGARDLERTREEVARAQRGLGLTLPLVVGFGVLWAGPLVAWLLPAFRPGVPALRVLALGASALGASSLPAVWLLGSGRAPTLLPVAAAAATAAGLLVFAVAARDPRPASVAIAAAGGYTIFAVTLVVTASRSLFAEAAARLRFAFESFAPALWGAGLSLGLAAVGPGDSAPAAAVRTLAFLAGYIPVLLWLGRGSGLWRLAREWISSRVAPA